MPRNDELLWHRWGEVDHLLNEVLDLPTDRRVAHLARQVGTDPALHDLVLRLLGRVDAESDRLNGPPEVVILGAFSGEQAPGFHDDLEPGTTVGRYIVVKHRGRGGMATVYEASRSDGAFEQRVALKVLRRGLDTDDLIRRFRNERQILSSLTDPHIARLLDGGSLADGRPYLVMDLVEGTPITTFADARRLDLRSRLTLFLDVASAIHAAHRQLVVHRDIKPSNILVTDDGRATLLDFGIAKLLEGDASHTAPGAVMLTPDYASPEQVRGGPITTGTDIYQLGLLLRELLTGLRPLAGDTSPGEPPVHPSRVATLSVAGTPEPEIRAEARSTTPAQLAKTLSGELDIIVNKALRPDPDERYASAEELAADVRRYLTGRPIQAHPESRGYLLRKFVARNPMVLPAVLAATVAITGFITMLVIQNRSIARERDAAEAASQRAVATEEFLVDILRSADPRTATNQVSPRDLTVVDALQRGRLRVNTELAGQPEVRASILAAIGRTFSGLGQYYEADTLLRQSLAERIDLFGTRDSRSFDLMSIIGDNHRANRDMAAADSIYTEELRLRIETGPVSNAILASLLGRLSATRLDLGDVDSAAVLVGRAVGLLRSAGDTSDFRYMAALKNLARALRGADQLDSAEAVYREILRRTELEAAPNPFELLQTHNNLGYLLRTRKDLPGAENSYREALRLAEPVLGDGHPTTLMLGSNLAAVLELEDKLDEVEALGTRQIAAAERQWPNGHWRVGAAHMALGRFLSRHERDAEAVAPMRAGVESFRRTLGAAHPWTAVAQGHLGAALVGSGHRPEGERQLDLAYVSLRDKQYRLDPELRFSFDRMITVIRDGGSPRQADRFAALLARLVERDR